MAGLPSSGLHFGLGLLSIGRSWGVADVSPLDDGAAADFLENAFLSGVRIFDTAPSYASSEMRLGKHLSTLSHADRQLVTVMTKMGEYWDFEGQMPVSDHSLDGLKKSIDRSLDLLGRIDLLQVHKATAENANHRDVREAISYARGLGIDSFGASVSSPEAAQEAMASGLYCSIQFPLNGQSPQFEPVATKWNEAGFIPIINRPFGMGRAVNGSSDPKAAAVGAFQFLTDRLKTAVILSGTSKLHHLQENLTAFAEAMPR